MQDKIEKIFDFMIISERLKKTKRWKKVRQMTRKETSADHSWHLAMFSLVVAKELNLNIDLLKALKIILVHDLVEALTGDIASVLIIKGERTEAEKKHGELKAIKKICKLLPEKSAGEVSDLWHEYNDWETHEAKFAKAMDRMESIFHMLIIGKKCFHYPEVIGPYSNKAVLQFPELIPLNHFLQQKLKTEFKNLGWEWKKEYELLCGEIETEKYEKILNFLKISENLKKTKRFLNTKEMKWKESSADHSWHVALLSFVVNAELDLKVDELRSLEIALVHDLPEALAGDTDFSLIAWGIKSKQQKSDAELLAMETTRKTLGNKTGKYLFELWQEYETAETSEAKYIKALDKIEGIAHMVFVGHKCFDHPELIAPYPRKAVVEKFPELIPLYRELLVRLKPDFTKLSWEWKKEYDV